MRNWLQSALVVSTLLAAPAAKAFPCGPGASPFTDVPDVASYCTNVLWLRNAAVTVGCGTGTTYCPDDSVTRAQMALFMNRLAKTLTPEILLDTGGPPQGDLDTDVFTCRSPSVFTVPPGTRRVLSTVLANLSILTGAEADIALGIDMSVNGGSFAPISTPTMAVNVPGNKWTTATILGSARIQSGAGSLELAAGDTVEFRVTMRRLAGSATTGEVTSTRCQLKIDIPAHWAQN
ncbi:MAG TPA: S-layer homology domain-containing protein [Casimicrobiaceae bacterium]|nr:S-layer homology domain-containing protein [Casimicrobiaceae bacterium]